MVLENVLQSALKDEARRFILLVISQVNLLLCLVNDMLDLKMIEVGRFVSRKETFSPAQTFKFIIDVFQLQAGQ